jgi:lysophospholipase L1-like esterase
MTHFHKKNLIGYFSTLFLSIIIFALIQVPNLFASTNNNSNNYVALGDSFSSGFGVEPYELNNDCMRSEYAYPKIIANQLKMNLSFYACSGATTKDFGLQQMEKQNAQLDNLNQNTKLVTLTIGGNDIGFSSVFGQLINNKNIDEIIKGVDDKIKALGGEISIPGIVSYDNLFNDIKKKAPNAQIVIVGYPYLYSKTNNCGDILSQTNKTWINATIDKLNNVIKLSAQKNNFFFTIPNFEGHELCSLNNDWISPIFIPNTTTINPSALHPTQAGQRAIAEAVIKVIEKANQKTVSTDKNLKSENDAKIQFVKIYKRKVNSNNVYDKNAITIMSNGLKSAKRSFLKEVESVKTFVKVYKQLPLSAMDWKIIQAIAYSGAKR